MRDLIKVNKRDTWMLSHGDIQNLDGAFLQKSLTVKSSPIDI